MSIYTGTYPHVRLGQALLIHYHLSVTTQAHQSLSTPLPLHRVTLYVPTKQREKGSQRERENRKSWETKTHRFSYTTGRLRVRLGYSFTSLTDYCTQRIHADTHLRACTHSDAPTALPKHTHHTHTAAKSPAAVSPNSHHHSVDTQTRK